MQPDELRKIIRAILSAHGPKREHLVPILQEIQEQASHLSPEALHMVAEHLGLSENDVYGVATFYAQFRFHPPGRHQIKVCQGTACHLKGSGRVVEKLSQKLAVTPGSTTEDGMFTLETVNCIGACALAMAAIVDNKYMAKTSFREIAARIDHLAAGDQGDAASSAVAPAHVLYDRITPRRLASAADLEAFCKEIVAVYEPDLATVIVCCGTGCQANGSHEVLQAFHTVLAAKGQAVRVVPHIKPTGCHGFCSRGPLVILMPEQTFYQQVKPEDVEEIVEKSIIQGQSVSRLLYRLPGKKDETAESVNEIPFYNRQKRLALNRIGHIDPFDINDAIAAGAYSGLAKALSGMTPEQVIDEVRQSGIRGRGGAGFPAGVKWTFCAKNPGPRYVICNADEGDPGAFMDRSILEGDPHSVIEGMLLCAYAVGSNNGYIYVRFEYPLAVRTLVAAIRQARVLGLLGKNILGSGFDFDIKIAKGAGAFVCGEETSLMQSIEGKRSMPRPRPPFPAVSGLFGKPTNINNVETLANIPSIVKKGGPWYASFGTEKSTGTKVFALTGNVNNVGLVEVPMGIPLKDIVYEIGGGLPQGKTLKAVQTGGPSGGCVPAKHFDLPVDYEHLAQVGSIMGSGGMIVIDEGSCMVDMAKYFLTFTEKESCGKCVPCRMGTQHLLRILTDITEGRGRLEHLEAIRRIGETMKKASLCGLGQTAPNPALTTLDSFMDEYLAHIQDHKCPAGVCRALIRFSIDAKQCTGCMACTKSCPVKAISGKKKKPHRIDQEKCIRCGACRQACKFDAVTVE